MDFFLKVSIHKKICIVQCALDNGCCFGKTGSMHLSRECVWRDQMDSGLLHLKMVQDDCKGYVALLIELGHLPLAMAEQLRDRGRKKSLTDITCYNFQKKKRN